MTLIIRSADMADLPDLKAFEQGIVRAERPFDPTIKPDPVSYYDLGELITSEDADVAVAEFDGTLIASGFVKKERSRAYITPDYHAHIGFLYVDPAYRGQSINRKILNHLFNWARLNGLKETRLTVYPENEAAVRAYQKVGFKPYITEMRLNLEDGNI